MKKSIRDIARVIRSKNAGPFELTFDIIFTSPETFTFAKERHLINEELMCTLYGISQDAILGIIWFAPANAVKVTITRRIPSGAPGETDIYGAQQHAPLLGITYDA